MKPDTADRGGKRAGVPREEPPERPRAAPPRLVKLAPAPRPVRPGPEDEGGHTRLVAALSGTALLLVAGALALAGWWVGDATRPAPQAPPPPVREVKIGPVGVAVSGEWSAVDGPRSLRGLDPAVARVFAPTAGLSVRAVLSAGPAVDPTLLPRALRTRLGDPVPEPVAVRVAGARAWTYRGPSPSGDGERLIEVTVLPTTAGVLSVGCLASHASWNAARGCAGGIERLDLAGARVLAPSEDLAFRQRLGAMIDGLDQRRVDLRRTLRRSRTAPRQAAAANRLSRVHRGVAATLAPLAPETGAPVKLNAALRDTARAYRRLAIGARRGSAVRYARARRGIRAAEARLERRLRRFDDPSARA